MRVGEFSKERTKRLQKAEESSKGFKWEKVSITLIKMDFSQEESWGSEEEKGNVNIS